MSDLPLGIRTRRRKCFPDIPQYQYICGANCQGVDYFVTRKRETTSNFKLGYSTTLLHVIQSLTYSGYIKCEILFLIGSHTQFQTWSLPFLLGSTFTFNMETISFCPRLGEQKSLRVSCGDEDIMDVETFSGSTLKCFSFANRLNKNYGKTGVLEDF